MKKLTKNLLITFGSVASITAPIVSVISCGESSPKEDPYLTDTGKFSSVDNKLHYTSKYINEHSDKFYGVASVLKEAFKDVVLPEDFKLPGTISILEDQSFYHTIFPENFKETFSGIMSFNGAPFDDTQLPKTYSPSRSSHGFGGLLWAEVWDGFKVPEFNDSNNWSSNNLIFLPAGLVWFDANGNQVLDKGHDTRDARKDNNGYISVRANWTVGKPKI